MIMIHEDILFEEATIIIASFCHNKREGDTGTGRVSHRMVGRILQVHVCLAGLCKKNQLS